MQTNGLGVAAALLLHRGGQVSAPQTDKRGIDTSRLTSLVCGDVDRDVLWGKGTLAGDPIDSLDVKGIQGMGPQAADGDADAGRYWGQEEKGTTEDEMAGWHH